MTYKACRHNLDWDPLRRVFRCRGLCVVVVCCVCIVLQLIKKKLAWIEVKEAQEAARTADEEEKDKLRQLQEARKAAKGDERPARWDEGGRVVGPCQGRGAHGVSWVWLNYRQFGSCPPSDCFTYDVFGSLSRLPPCSALPRRVVPCRVVPRPQAA